MCSSFGSPNQNFHNHLLRNLPFAASGGKIKSSSSSVQTPFLSSSLWGEGSVDRVSSLFWFLISASYPGLTWADPWHCFKDALKALFGFRVPCSLCSSLWAVSVLLPLLLTWIRSSRPRRLPAGPAHKGGLLAWRIRVLLRAFPEFRVFKSSVIPRNWIRGPRKKQVWCNISAFGLQLCLCDLKTISLSSPLCPIGWPSSSAAIGNLSFN